VVIVLAVLLSLYAVVQGALRVTIVGSIPLFAVGTAVFLFAMISLDVSLSTIARTMPQFGLLAIPFFCGYEHTLERHFPSGEYADSPAAADAGAPSTHYTSFAKAVLYRERGCM
jgi:ABC-2 type transport system permease protein